jgi:IstB-like ATP binding protein
MAQNVPRSSRPELSWIFRRGRLHPFDHGAANLFFQFVASRYEQGSGLVTSNLPFGRWREVFGDEIVGAAMIDRLVHHAEALILPRRLLRPRRSSMTRFVTRTSGKPSGSRSLPGLEHGLSSQVEAQVYEDVPPCKR